jgi:hypothetical protein
MRRTLLLAVVAMVALLLPSAQASAGDATRPRPDVPKPTDGSDPWAAYVDGWADDDVPADTVRSVEEGAYRSAAVCFERSYTDPEWDTQIIDAYRYGLSFDCSEQTWAFGMLTYDDWVRSELDYLFVHFDTDLSASTGCAGDDYVLVGGYDNGLYAGVIRTPSCTSSTWTDMGAAYIDRAGSVDFIGMAFGHAQIGRPPSFRYHATSESVYSYTVERMPNSGTHTESGWAASQPAPQPQPAPSSGSGNGYWLFAADGGMFSFGNAPFYGSLGDGRCTEHNPPLVDPGTYQTCTDMAVTPSGNGYWLVDWNCRVTAFGDAVDYGDAHQGQGPAWDYDAWGECYIEPTPTGRGYWLANSFGGVKALGDAQFYGGTDADLPNDDLVGIKRTASGRGYWLVDYRGAIYTYGDAAFHGSTGNMRLNGGIVSMATTAKRDGYWLVGTDGGIFSFGAAPFFGSTGNMRLNLPVWGMATTPSGNGYWLFALDGGIFTFGDARFLGSTGAIRLNAPIIGMGVRWATASHARSPSRPHGRGIESAAWPG